LTFSGYFEEGSKQIRKCNIFFYLEDSSIKIVEKPQLNSGVTQGTVVRRNIILKPDGNNFSGLDFKLGEDIVIYGRPYRFVTFLKPFVVLILIFSCIN
jgi:hypothetical protein